MEPLYKENLSSSRSEKLSFDVSSQNHDLVEIGRLRAQVWQSEGVYVPDFEGSEKDCWLDDLDPHSTHFVVRDGDKIIAAARLSYHQDPRSLPDFEWLEPMYHLLKEPCVSLNRLVVDSAYRGRGIARKLDCQRMDFAYKKMARTAVVIGVGHTRVKALEGLGFTLSHYLPEGNGLMTPEYPLGALYRSI